MAKQKPTEAQIAEALDQAIAKAAPDVASGKTDMADAVDGISTTLDVPGKEVKAKLEEAVEPLKKAIDAQAKAKDAQDAADKAKQQAEEAQVAAAEARGEVVVNVPQQFKLVISAGEGTKPKTHLIKAGTTTLPRALAEHPYSKANGVKILGEKK